MSVTTASISANIPQELSEMLNRVATAEERSKSYYIKKGLEQILRDRLEDIEDYEEAKAAHEEFLASGEAAVPLDEVFKSVP